MAAKKNVKKSAKPKAGLGGPKPPDRPKPPSQIVEETRMARIANVNKGKAYSQGPAASHLKSLKATSSVRASSGGGMDRAEAQRLQRIQAESQLKVNKMQGRTTGAGPQTRASQTRTAEIARLESLRKQASRSARPSFTQEIAKLKNHERAYQAQQQRRWGKQPSFGRPRGGRVVGSGGFLTPGSMDLFK